MANALIQNPVDRENHIVHGVKVLGFTSANGRIYDFAAVKEAISKYEKAPVNKDHNMEEPSFSDRLGWLENVTLQKDGLYADFHYNPHADGIESFLWFAEHNGLGDVGFSHLVSGKYSVDPDGTERITRIDKVKSVDLVANPATTKTIFESEVKPMEKKVIEEAESKPTLTNRDYWNKSDDELKKIQTQSSQAYKRHMMYGPEKTAFKYYDQNSDATTVLAYRERNKSEQEGEPMDSVEEARAEPKPTLTNQSYWNKSYEALKSIGKQAREASARMLKMGDMKNAMKYDEQNADAATVLGYRERNPKDPIKPEQEGEPIGKKIAKEAGNAANKVKKNELDRKKGEDFMKRNSSLFKPTPGFPNQLPADYDYKPAQKAFGRSFKKGTSKDVGEADSDEREFEMAVDSLDRLLMKDKISQKDYDKKYDELSKKMKDKKRYPVKPEQEGDDEMDNKKMMEEENPMQEEGMQEPMMEEADDVYAKIKEICEGEGSDEEKSKQVLEMLGLSGGMSEGEGEPMEEAEEDPEEKDGSKSAVLEVDDEEDKEEEPKKESKSELASLRKWKAEKLKEEKIVNLIKESNLEPTKVFIKQLSAIDSKLWSEAINDRKKVALVKSSVKPISSGLQSRSESSYKQFLESVLGK